MTTVTKSKSKSKSKKLNNEIIDNISDDNDNQPHLRRHGPSDRDNDTEIDKKLLSKKVIKIQNETVLQLQTKFIQSND